MSGPSYLNTAQNVNLEHKIADMGTRIGAFVIDSIIKFGYMMFIVVLAGASGMSSSPWILSIFFLPMMFYTLLFEVFTEGQTPGKKSQNIQVVSDLMTGVVALVAIGASVKSQRLGDIVANTLVISTKEKVRLEDTGYLNINENYLPTYPTVTNLSYADIRTIQEVLSNQSEDAFSLVTETAQKIETILAVEKKESSRSFLRKVISDFNYFQKVG